MCLIVFSPPNNLACSTSNKQYAFTIGLEGNKNQIFYCNLNLQCLFTTFYPGGHGGGGCKGDFKLGNPYVVI